MYKPIDSVVVSELILSLDGFNCQRCARSEHWLEARSSRRCGIEGRWRVITSAFRSVAGTTIDLLVVLFLLGEECALMEFLIECRDVGSFNSTAPRQSEWVARMARSRATPHDGEGDLLNGC
jgi:hypothetical protein